MSKQVQQFITRMDKEIQDGLLQLSGTRFDKGDTPMDALRAKAFGVRLMSGKSCTVGQAAADMNAMMDIMDALDGKPIFKKRLSSGLAPKNVEVAETSTRPYGDETTNTYLIKNEIVSVKPYND